MLSLNPFARFFPKKSLTSTEKEKGTPSSPTSTEDAFDKHVKRAQQKPLTSERILEGFQEWLSSQHMEVQDELRRKKEERKQTAPIVDSVRRLERASGMVKEYERLCIEIVALEARYNALESCQLVSDGYYTPDFADANTLTLFQEYMAKAEPEKWWDYKDGYKVSE